MLNKIKAFLARVWAFVQTQLDPDRNWRSPDKLQHLAGGFSVRVVMMVKESGWDAIFWSTVIAVVFELGQLDVARSQKLLGKPGFGVGLIDLAYGVAGILAAHALLAAL